MKISVITVTFNSLPALQRTARSVACQDFADYEYIVVDGASEDGTRDYLEKQGIGVSRWVSEPDHGIYEAMNKGAKMAAGDYCLFLNAGDCFVDKTVLTRMARQLDGTDLVLGNAVHVDESGTIDGFICSRGGFSLQNLFQSAICHQATFIRRELMLSRPYDESLRLVADWKFFLECFLDGTVSRKEVPVDVCFFFAGGATDKNLSLGKGERQSVLDRYPEYRPVWEAPYRPSLAKMVRSKTLYYLSKVKYAAAIKECL